MARKRIRRRVLATRVTIQQMERTKRNAALRGQDVATYMRDLLDRDDERLAAERAPQSSANAANANASDAPALQAAA